MLEIGSGTGQHAAYFAPEFPHLVWQASDVAENLPGIREWIADPAPIELDVDGDGPPWRPTPCTRRIPATSCPGRKSSACSPESNLAPAVLAIYGPFNYNGRHTSESNARFDAMLRGGTRQAGCATSRLSMPWPSPWDSSCRKTTPCRRTTASSCTGRRAPRSGRGCAPACSACWGHRAGGRSCARNGLRTDRGRHGRMPRATGARPNGRAPRPKSRA